MPDKKFIYFIFLLSHVSSYGQDLRKAALSYFIDQHFVYDNNLIANNKIKLIEKHQYYYKDDSLYSDLIVEKHQFNKYGKPEYTYKKPAGTSKNEMYFTYDKEGSLIKKEIYGIAPSLNYKLIESYEWFYTDVILVGQKRYNMTDNMPAEKGAYYFPEKLFLFSKDTIIYYDDDTSCSIISNSPDNFKDATVSLYTPNFLHVIYTTLKFHLNNKIKSITVKRDSKIQKSNFDLCGNPLTDSLPNTRCLKRLPNKSICLTQQELNICNEADTMILNNEKVYFIKDESIHQQHSSGPETIIVKKGISYYNREFKVIGSMDTTTHMRGNMAGVGPFPDFTRIRISVFVYFENGLLKRIITKDENGTLIEGVEYKMEYYY